MSTVVLNAYSKAYPSISNRLRAAVYTAASPLAIVASIIEVGTHNARIWSFPGLPRTNYRFSLDEIDGSGNPINNIANFDVVPGQLDGSIVRGDEQYQVDTQAGFVSGTNTFTFNGTSSTPDFRGWEITPSELSGRGICVRGVDYSWDKVTGIFLLLQTGDVFSANTYWNFHFDPKVQPAGNSAPTVFDVESLLKINSYTLDVQDFGKKLILEPAGNYIEITLPDIATVPAGRRLYVEMSNLGRIACAKFITTGADILAFLRANLFILPTESFSIYKFIRDAATNTYEWRVEQPDGSFRTVGQTVSHDMDSTAVWNCQYLNGANGDIFQHARIYNEYVLNLPVTQRVNYDDWATGNNKYFFSLANSANPANANKFKFPDRRGLFERMTKAGVKAGDWQDWAMVDHKHEETIGTLPTSLFGRGQTRMIGNYNGVVSSGLTDLVSGMLKADGTPFTNIQTEVRVVNNSINKYVLL
jgi:hypothetical protein